MNVLWITERFPPDRGGAATSAQRQVESVAPHVNRLDVLTLSKPVEAGRVNLESHPRYQIYRVGDCDRHDESLQTLAQTAHHLCQANRYHIIHGFYAVHAGYVATQVAQAQGIPSLVSLRGNDVDRSMFHGPRLPFLLWTLEKASAVASVTQDLLNKAAVISGRTQGMHTLYNSVDATAFCPGESDPSCLAELEPMERPWIGFSGELRFKKGLPVLQELAVTCARKQWGTVVSLGGVRRDEKSSLARWRQENPEASRCFHEMPYRSEREELIAAYRTLDLFVFPSFWDGLPNALLEVMACAKPVIGSQAGGLGEIIQDGKTGVLVKPDQFDRFFDIVWELWTQDPNRAKALGTMARKYVGEHHRPSQERDALLEIYRQLTRST